MTMTTTHSRNDAGTGKRRIAVLGGGMASLTAVLELTAKSSWRDDYDITVYQLGWRLGGKGASSRDPESGQIREHGLHLFYGFYENAFRVMRDVYAELGEDWRQHFTPQQFVLLEEPVDDKWVHWPILFPQTPGEPGDGYLERSPIETVAQALEGLAGMVTHAGLASTPTCEVEAALTRQSDSLSGAFAARARRRVDAVLRRAATELKAPQASLYLHAAARYLDGLRDDWGPRHTRTLIWLLAAWRTWARRPAERHRDKRHASRRIGLGIDLLATIVIGLLDEGLLEDDAWDWHRLDDEDLSAFLRRHGALAETATSTPVHSIYDAAFSRGSGIGAGTALHAMWRMFFTYKGAFFWKMNAGMGETIFASMYRVLKARGVRFAFFSRVDEVRCDADAITGITVGRQASCVGDYDPLVDVDGTSCWPPAPRFDQLDQGTELEASGQDLENAWSSWEDPLPPLELELGRDFDDVILGISLAGLRRPCRALCEVYPKFGDMIDRVQTTATQATQLYFRPTLHALGYPGPSPIAIRFAAPFDTWADMTHLANVEHYPRQDPPGFIAYACGRMVDNRPPPEPGPSTYADDLAADAIRNVERWLEQEAPSLWPRLQQPAAADLCGAPDALAAQVVSVPLNPSDRYVLSAPGTTRHRLRVSETPWHNLALAGDWVRTSMNIGCIEGATMAGLEAARALGCRDVAIVGDWLPASAPRPRRPACPLPMLIQRPGEVKALQPYHAHAHRMHWFFLPADRDRLQALCDATLNLGGPIQYRPLLPLVMFAASTIERMGSTLPDAYGQCEERDFGFWLPLVAGRRERGVFVAERAVAHIPALWVDSGAAAEGGREIFGFPKAVAELRCPADSQPGQPIDSFTIDTLTIPTRSRHKKAQMRRLLEVRRIPDAPPALGGARSVARMLKRVAASSGATSTALSLITDLASRVDHREVPFVFLKQFPDVADGRRACYQAIVEAAAQVAGPLDVRPTPGSWEVRIERHASQPLVEALGLAVSHEEGGATVTPCLAQGVAEFDFLMHAGDVVWDNVARRA